MLTEQEIKLFEQFVSTLKATKQEYTYGMLSAKDVDEMMENTGLGIIIHVELFQKILQELPKLKTAFDLLYDTRYTSSGTSQFHERVIALIGDYEP